MTAMARAREIIELDDDSDEASILGRPLDFHELDDLLDLEANNWQRDYPVNLNNDAFIPDVRNRIPNPLFDFERLIEDQPFPRMEQRVGLSQPGESVPPYSRPGAPVTPSLPPALPDYERCLDDILQVFPEISYDHVKELYDAEVKIFQQDDASNALVPNLIDKILEKGKYPKEKDRLKELKRKRALDSDEEELAEFRSTEMGEQSARVGPYHNISKVVLQEDFVNVPAFFIDLKLRETGQFFKTYQSIEAAEREWETIKDPPYQRLKRPRKKTHLSTLADLDRYIDSMASQGYGVAELKREIAAARRQRKKLDDMIQTQKTNDAAERAKDKEYLARGDVLACCLCLDEETPTYKIIHCDNDTTPHFTCFSCFREYAKDRIGVQEWELKCADSSGCDATFTRSQRAKALDAKTMETLDRLQQQAEIKKAGMKGLSHCPFCHFAAICPSIEEDWEFRCGNPECEKVSCRRCDRESHVPKSCKEAKEEQGLDERHLVEEARTAALIKKCPGCGRGIIKEGGCNRVLCLCGRYICDVCGKDTTGGYNHFGEVTGILKKKGVCPLYTDDAARAEKGVQEAEDKARKKILEENPDISEEDLRIKFKENFRDGHLSPNGQFARQMGLMPGQIPRGYPGGYGVPLIPPGLPPRGNWAAPPAYAPQQGYGYAHMAPPMEYPWGPPAQHRAAHPHAPAPMGNFGQRRRHAPDAQMQMPAAFPLDGENGYPTWQGPIFNPNELEEQLDRQQARRRRRDRDFDF